MSKGHTRNLNIQLFLDFEELIDVSGRIRHCLSKYSSIEKSD